MDGGKAEIANDVIAAGPIGAVIDFAGTDATARLAMAVLPKAGRLVLVGIGGGELTLSVAGTIFRALTIQGSLTGSIAELREVLALARRGELAATPLHRVPKREVNQVMAALEEGQITGRVVLIRSCA